MKITKNGVVIEGTVPEMQQVIRMLISTKTPEVIAIKKRKRAPNPLGARRWQQTELDMIASLQNPRIGEFKRLAIEFHRTPKAVSGKYWQLRRKNITTIS